MATDNSVPKLITFDGEARSGKGTIAHYIKHELQERGTNVMLTDRGQIFRVLVVAAERLKTDFDDPAQLDSFLGDPAQLESAAKLIKDVYKMPHEERDALLYTKRVGENSAKMGGRPLAQEFSIRLMEQWFRDAKNEGVEVILLDGRALENKGVKLEKKGLCDYVLGLYFTCDPQVGARRTLGYANKEYAELTAEEKADVDGLVAQIKERNHADMTRDVQRLGQPATPHHFRLPDLPALPAGLGRQMAVIDTSAEISKAAMCEPVFKLVEQVLDQSL
jgi:cytidylate kinase